MLQAIAFLIAIVIHTNVYAKSISITFDDAPMPGSKLFTSLTRTQKIISALKNENVTAGFFVIGLHAIHNQKVLQLYDDAGHMIGNHTYSHYNCSQTSAEKFSKDITKAHKVIQHYKNFQPLFRYPYLNECNESQKKFVNNTLQSMQYKNGYVTIVSLDYYVNDILQKALKSHKTIHYDKLKEIYLKNTLDNIEFYSEFINKKLSYDLSHVLLLHENDISALYLEDLIKLLKSKGWTIISPNDAYKSNKIDVTHIRKNLPYKYSLSTTYLHKLLTQKEVFTSKIE